MLNADRLASVVNYDSLGNVQTAYAYVLDNVGSRTQMAAWPIERPANWIEHVNGVETEAELASLRRSIERGRPFGSSDWQVETARRRGLEAAYRARGRPKKLALARCIADQ